MPVRKHVLIEGRVQGVAFRAYTEQEARRRGLGGWVRNLADGRVEAVFEGEEAEVEAMIAWCREGPPAARVTGLSERALEGSGTRGFEMRPTASGPAH